MNLNDQPTIDKLARLFAAHKDTHDSHVLWVCKSGEVRIDCLSPHSAENEFEQSHPSMLARFRTYRRGQGYVGKKAAADKDFIGRVLQTLTQQWNQLQHQTEVSVVDRYC